MITKIKKENIVRLVVGLIVLVFSLGIGVSLKTLTLTKPLASAGASGTTRPNIVLIVTDDQRWDGLWAMPTVQAELVNKGVTFTDYHVTTSLCCPSRSSILKGQYSHNTHCYNNGVCLSNYDNSKALNTWLYDAGYRTGLVGKYLNNYGQNDWSPPPKWSRWVALAPAYPNYLGVYYSYRLTVDGQLEYPGDYSTDRLGREAVDFVNIGDDRPFFLYFAPSAPHEPANPSLSDEDICNNSGHIWPCQIMSMPPWRPPNYNEADISDKPNWLKSTPPIAPATAANQDNFHKAQLISLLPVDRAIGQIIAALQKNGKLNNTVFFFTSDNGLGWGEHRLFKRECPYEECLREPLIIRGPGVAPGITNSNPALNIDLAPTILDLAGIPTPTDLKFDGISLKPILAGQNFRNRAVMFEQLIDLSTTTSSTNFYAVKWRIGDKQMVYTFYPGTGESELYDLSTDPYQLQNQTSNSDYAVQKNFLQQALTSLLAGRSYDEPEPAPVPVPTPVPVISPNPPPRFPRPTTEVRVNSLLPTTE